MAMPSSTASSPDALSTDGLDWTNSTVQADFLAELLDDTELQVTSNSYARYFWYGIVVTIALATICNLLLTIAAYLRYRQHRFSQDRAG